MIRRSIPGRLRRRGPLWRAATAALGAVLLAAACLSSAHAHSHTEDEHACTVCLHAQTIVNLTPDSGAPARCPLARLVDSEVHEALETRCDRPAEARGPPQQK